MGEKIPDQKDESLSSRREQEVSGKKEKLKFLERHEIKTMEKDTRRLREKEAAEERERIISLGEEGERKKERKKISKKEGEEAFSIPRPPKRVFPKKKVIIRVLFVLSAIFIIGLTYWTLRGEGPLKFFIPEESPPQEEDLPPEEREEEEQIEIPVPASFFPVGQTISLEITGDEEIKNIPAELEKIDLPLEDIARIAIKNTSEGILADIEDIFQAFEIYPPEGLFQVMDQNDFNLFVYPQEEGNRFVLIAKVTEKEGLKEALAAWEDQIETEGLSVSREKISTLASSFKTFEEEGFSFRYLTISREDLGICHFLFEDYLVLTNSFKSLEKTKGELEEKRASDIQGKIGQLFIVGINSTTVDATTTEFFRTYKPGGVLLLSRNIDNENQLKKLTADLQELSLRETGFPLLIAVDQEGELSRIDFLEEKTPQSEIDSTTTSYEIGLKRGQELQELGINLNLAPLLENAGEEDFYFNRSFQKDPETAGELAKFLILGQKETGLLTAVKHFPGYTGISFDPEERLAETSLPEISQFQKALEAEPDLIMVSNAIYPEITPSLPFTFSPEAIQYLKDNLDSQILIVSDDLNQKSLLEEFSLKETVVEPLRAGVDLLIFSGWQEPVYQGPEALLEAVKEGEVEMSKIEKALSRISQLKKDL